MRRLPSLALLLASLIACSSESKTTTPPADTGPSDTGTGEKYAEPTADPPPADLPVAIARAKDTDEVPDVSCLGKPMPVKQGTATEREFHLIDLGQTDKDRAPGIKVEIFLSNKVDTADVTVTSGAGDASDPNRGVFKAAVTRPYLTFRTTGTTDYLTTLALDLPIPETGIITAQVAKSDTTAALSILIAGADYTAAPGSGRVVGLLTDCKDRPIANAHLAIELDDVVVAPVAKGAGMKRNYFGDNQLPSPGKLTSRSGVIAILDVPAAPKKVRLVARGRLTAGGPIQVLAARLISVVPDGLTTAGILPYLEP